MRLLILTQYFPPETGAPQNRLYELALRLKAKGIDVDILTAMPNYPKMEIMESYKGKNYVEEVLDGLKIYRSKIYVSKSKSVFKRLLIYFSFVFSSYKSGKKLNNYDFILCESPPLFLGYSAIKLSKKLGAKLIFNVADLWPESAEKLGIVKNKIFLKMAYKLEARIYKKSFLITGQASGIRDNIKTRFPEKDVYWLSNGVDTKKINNEVCKPFGIRAKYKITNEELLFFYGGILGHAQGLDIILHVAEKTKELPIKYMLMGSGPEKSKLLKLHKELGLKNVIFAEPVGRTEVANVIKEIDISIVPLKKLDLFLGIIPSKIFEILSMSKPILLGVDGEAKNLFIENGKAGWFYEPENLDALEQQIRYITENREELVQKGKNGRTYVVDNFDRGYLVEKFHSYLIKKIETIE